MEEIKLNDLCHLITCGVAKRPEYHEDGVPFLSSLNVKENRIILDKFKYVSFEDHEKLTKYSKPENNDILYTRVGSYGEAAVVNLDMDFSIFVSLTLLKPKLDLINPRYLMWYLNSPKVRDFANQNTTGVGVQNLNVSVVRDYSVPLPPLSTQKAIAEKLDKADALRKKDKELLAQYDDLAQAIFIDMFGDPVKNEKGWEIKSLDDVCNKITDGEHGTVKRLNSGFLYLMARNIRNNEIDFSEVSYISESDHNKIYRRCNAEQGDILLICVGATIGRTCIVPKMQEFSLARSVALIKPDRVTLNSQYLNTYLSLDFIQTRIKSSSNTSAQAGLYTGAIKEFKITIPPIKLQTHFAEKIQNIEAQKAIVKQQAQQSEDLFQALLQESFNFN